MQLRFTLLPLLAALILSAFQLFSHSAFAQSVRWEPSGGSLARRQITHIQLVFENCQIQGNVTLPAVTGLELQPTKSRSQSVRTVSGHTTQTTSYGVTAIPTTNQRVTIPAFKVYTDKGELTVPSVSFDVGTATVQDGQNMPDDVISSRFIVPQTVWTGEVFPLTYRITAQKRFLASLGSEYPDWDSLPINIETWPKYQTTEEFKNGEPLINITYNTRAVARAPGDITLNPARQVVALVTRRPGTGFDTMFGFPQQEKFAITSNQPAITIKPLPAGAPASFAGAVGQFTLESKVGPSTATVGEPVTWTLTLTGTGNWPDITGLPPRYASKDFQGIPPALKRVPLKENAIFESTLSEDVVLFPSQPGFYTFDPVQWSYFDPAQNHYVTITTPATTIAIAPTTGTLATTSQISAIPAPPRSITRSNSKNVESKHQVCTHGFDIMLAIDLSGSMLSEDYEDHGEPLNRLQAIKPFIQAFITDRPNDRIGVVLFAGRAYTLVPPTLDHDWLARQFKDVRVGLIEDGTAIGDGLGLALARLEQSDRTVDGCKPQRSFVILLTDGANNRGILTPQQAAAIAKDRGIPVYTIGAGREGSVPFPVFDNDGTRIDTRSVTSDLDEETLHTIALETGGRYFRARDNNTIKSAFADIDRARPQKSPTVKPAPDRSRGILIALDLSRSMDARDIKPSRLDRARLLVSNLLEKLEGERVGLITFSGTAFFQSPFSANHKILRDLLPHLNTGFLPEGGTNYRAFLDTSINSFDSTATADRRLVIFSDGESNDDDWLPLADELKNKNIRVVALGVGTEAGSVVPDGTGGYIKDERGAVVLSKLKSEDLRGLAAKTNGVYFDASGWVDFSQILDIAARKNELHGKTTQPSDMQQVGGSADNTQRKSADTRMVTSLQKLDEVCEGDAPAFIFQRMQTRQSGTSRPMPDATKPKGKDW